MTTNEYQSKDLMSYDDLSKYLGYAKPTLYAKVRERVIPHIRLNKRKVKFCKEDIDKWVDSQKVMAEPFVKELTKL
jgi:excisionase family DNA binding protein